MKNMLDEAIEDTGDEDKYNEGADYQEAGN